MSRSFVLVTGSRSYTNEDLVWQQLDLLPDDVTILTGACPTGADEFAKDWVVERGRSMIQVPADWDRHKKLARVLGNQSLLERYKPVGVLVFSNKKGSEGTAETAGEIEDVVCRAQEMGVPVRVFKQGTTLRQMLTWRRTGLLEEPEPHPE